MPIRLPVHGVFQCLARLELWLFESGNLKAFAGLGIAALAGCPISDAEVPEPGHLNSVTVFERAGNGIKYHITALDTSVFEVPVACATALTRSFLFIGTYPYSDFQVIKPVDQFDPAV